VLKQTGSAYGHAIAKGRQAILQAPSLSPPSSLAC
jgi:hypothetical protein